MDRAEILELTGRFTWFWGDKFFIETDVGNFVWSSPDYGGDNSLEPYDGDLGEYAYESGVSFGRDKGEHVIADYIGDWPAATS